MSFVSLAATVVTILYFLASTSTTRQFYRQKSTGKNSFIPYAATFCNCVFWLKYGLLLDDLSMILVNLFGAVLALFSILIYYNFTEYKPKVERIASVYGIWIIAVLAFIKYNRVFQDPSQNLNALGWICSTMTVIMFGAPLVSIGTVIRSRSSRSVLDGNLLVAGLAVSSLWTIYGLQLGDPFVYVTNGLGAALSFLQLLVFAAYYKGGNGADGKNNNLLSSPDDHNTKDSSPLIIPSNIVLVKQR